MTPRLDFSNDTPRFIHLVRKYDADLVYTVQSSTDLSPGSWGDADLGEADIVPFDADYDVAIRPVLTDGHRMFFRLRISYP